MPIVFLLLLFLFLQSSPSAPPPGNYYPNASYVPPPEPPRIPVSALPPRPMISVRPPGGGNWIGRPPPVAPPTPAASQALNNFDATSLLNRYRAANAATSPDVVTSALTPFHRGV